jgi:hypothetical protein
MNSENYLTIQGFMICDLKLKGIDVLTYAYVFSKCQDRNGATLNIGWIAEWASCTHRAIFYSLQRLRKKDLIIVEKCKGKPSKYRINKDNLALALNKGYGNICRKNLDKKEDDISIRKIISDVKKIGIVPKYFNDDGQIPFDKHIEKPSVSTSDEEKKRKELQDFLTTADWTYHGDLPEDEEEKRKGNLK